MWRESLRTEGVWSERVWTGSGERECCALTCLLCTCAHSTLSLHSLRTRTLCSLQHVLTQSSLPTRPLRTAPRSLLGALHPSPPIGRGHATPPPAFPRFGNRQMRKMRFCFLDPRGVSAGHLAAATPRLHPSLGECHHTVHVGWRVPLVVCVVVGEVASSRAWCMMWSMM